MGTIEDLNRGQSIPEAFFNISRQSPDSEVYRQAHAQNGIDGERAWEGVSYRTVRERVLKIAAYLLSAGVGRGTKVAILSASRPEWLEADLAVLSLGAVVVSVYQSLPAAEVGYILFDSQCEVVFAENEEQVEKLLSLISSPCAIPATEERAATSAKISLKHIISFEETKSHALVTNLNKVLLESRADESVIAGDLTRNILAALVYTSGTTGPPKGVMQTHGNHLANVRQAHESGLCSDTSTIFLMLPLAHSFAKLMGYIGFLTPTKLLLPAVVDRSTSKLHAASVTRDLREGSAQIVPLVPRLLEKMRDGVVAQGRAKGFTGLVVRVTLWASGEVYRCKAAGSQVSILARIAFEGTGAIRAKIRERLFGPRFINCIAGGAKLNVDVARFFDALGIEICEGYGLTETCVATNVNLVGRKKIGTVGPRLASDIEVKLASDGEILFRGPNVAAGYYNRAAATKAAWDSEGWFHTGDLGELDSDGFLKIAGRKKELIVSSYGKNIAPEHIEQALKNSPYISQAVLAGDDKPYCVAVLTLEGASIGGWAKEKKIALTDNWHVQREVQTLISAEVEKVNAALASYETVKKFIVVKDDFTVENGFLTPTFKVKRKKVTQNYGAEIEALYSGE